MKRFLLLLFFLPLFGGLLFGQKLEFKPVIIPAISTPSTPYAWESPVTGSLHLGSQFRPAWQAGIYFRGEAYPDMRDRILFAPNLSPRINFLEGGLYAAWTPRLWDFPVRPVLGVDLGIGTARALQLLAEIYVPDNQLYYSGTVWLGLEWEWNKYLSMRLDAGYRFFHRPGTWPLVYEGTGFTVRTGIQIKINP